MLATIPLILVLLLVIVLLVRVGMLLMSRRSRVERPSCGACGYPVTGLEGLRCPECGAELLKVGIQTPAMRRDPGPAARITLLIVLWTILLPFPALVITGLAVRSLPTARVTRLMSPASAAYGDVTIAIGAEEEADQRARLELRRNDGSLSPPLVVDLREETYRIVGARVDGADPPEGAGAAPVLDRAAVLAWMADAGVAAGDPGLATEADEMIDQLRIAAIGRGATATAGTTGGGFGGTSWSTEPLLASRTWFKAVVLGFWLLVWVGGISGIARRYRGRGRGSREETR